MDVDFTTFFYKSCNRNIIEERVCINFVILKLEKIQEKIQSIKVWFS